MRNELEYTLQLIVCAAMAYTMTPRAALTMQLLPPLLIATSVFSVFGGHAVVGAVTAAIGLAILIVNRAQNSHKK